MLEKLKGWYARLTPNQMLGGLIALLLAYQVARVILGIPDPIDCSTDWDGMANVEDCN